MEVVLHSQAILGRAVRDARKRRGLTQTGLAKRAGVSQSTISNLERGIGATDLEKLVLITSVLGLELVVRPRPSNDSPSSGEWWDDLDG